jgi:hypothetical protein
MTLLIEQGFLQPIKNLGDSLAGRIALLDLLPFSINEKKSDEPENDSRLFYRCLPFRFLPRIGNKYIHDSFSMVWILYTNLFRA